MTRIKDNDLLDAYENTHSEGIKLAPTCPHCGEDHDEPTDSGDLCAECEAEWLAALRGEKR